MEKATPHKLIEAATPLFAIKGFSAVSVRQLAESAEVNIAAISYYYRGKEGLYQAVLEDQFSPISQVLDEAETATGIPATERLMLYAEHIAVIHEKRPYLMRFMHSELINPTPCFDLVVKKQIARVFQYLRAAITEGMTAGDFHADLNPDYAALSLAGILNFYFIAKPLFNEFATLPPNADHEYTTQAFRIYLDGLRGRHHA